MFFNVSAPSLISGMSGESEKKIRELFFNAKNSAPSIIFLDEIDAITPKRDQAEKEMERRIVAQLLTCIDDLATETFKSELRPVLVIGATNRPDSLDPALRRAGRFDKEISVSVPSHVARIQILQSMCSKLPINEKLNWDDLAAMTPGYVPADLKALTGIAGTCAIERFIKEYISHDLPTITFSNEELVNHFIAQYRDHQFSNEELSILSICANDFHVALKLVSPSSTREGFYTLSNTTFEDIGALNKVIDELSLAVIEPLKNRNLFKHFNLTVPTGLLLWGPPGCGKTLLARALANQSRSNFIAVKGPELLNKYVGESEAAIRALFTRARASSPCIVFFDELDALCSKRDESNSEVSMRVVNTLLTELDGLNSRKDVFIVAATNRPDMIDPAMLRPGRLDKKLFVGLPVSIERAQILSTIARNSPISDDVDFSDIGTDPRCERYSGADLASLVRTASLEAIKPYLNCRNIDLDLNQVKISKVHFNIALDIVKPSVSSNDMKNYLKLADLFESL